MTEEDKQSIWIEVRATPFG